MAHVTLDLHPRGFAPARVRALPRQDCLLVIDRVSGRWLTLDRAKRPLLALLGARESDLPESVLGPVRDLRALLVEHEIGVPGSERRFDQLNTVILKLTNACNFACTYCYDFEEFEHATTLSAESGRRVLSEALDLAGSELWVILHGGEPMLLWDRIEELVEAGNAMAEERGKRINFVGQTNMSRVNDRVVEFSYRHGIAWGVSVDGLPEVHDAARVTRRGTGTYATFRQALERYPRFVRRCGVMTTVTAINQGRLLECARHFRDLGMASWDWSLFQPIGRGRGAAGRFMLDTDRLVEAWTELFEAVEAGEFDGFPILPVKKYVDNFIAGPGGNMCMRGECGAARDLLSISANGSIEACDCIDPTGPLAGLGHLDTGTLAEARSSPVAEAIRARDLTLTPCGGCLWYGVCGGTCLAHAPALNDVWADGCALAMRAFDRISDSLVRSDRLVRYVQSLG